jgi:DnaJ-class molecular chaperone
MKDFYQVLGVQSTADDGTIKSAYRKLAKENHPDLKPGDKAAEERFKEINEAYEVLKDQQKRAQYDAQRSGGFRGNQTFHWSNQPYSPDVDIEEILKDIRRSRNPFGDDARNHDIRLAYSITLEESFTGKEASIQYNLPNKETQEIKIKIPAGIQDGIKLRFQGKGDDAMKNVKPGDLYIRINVIPHPTFARVGDNLVTSASIGYLDALVGSEVEIPTIEGSRIKMRIPAGIHPGQSLRAAGKGMPLADGRRGDMMVEVVISPEKLSEEERQTLISLRDQRKS